MKEIEYMFLEVMMTFSALNLSNSAIYYPFTKQWF